MQLVAYMGMGVMRTTEGTLGMMMTMLSKSLGCLLPDSSYSFRTERLDPLPIL